MGRMTAPETGVRVRMYRQGLGDCFLLALGGADGQARYLLIDCGVVVGAPDVPDVMVRTMADIREATGGHIHVLVATHEHWDHLSGFGQAEALFRQIRVDALWLPWTEDPGDATAGALRRERRMAVGALRAAVARLQEESPLAASRIGGVVEFFGAVDPSGLGAGPSTSDLLELVRSQAGVTRYLRPGGATIGIDGVPNVRVYVLGPPTDVTLLKKSAPGRGGRSEVYQEHAALDEETAFYAAATPGPGGAADLSPDERDALERSFPFDPSCRIGGDRAKEDAFFRQHYGFGEDDEASWRRVGGDWLQAAGELALRLDAATNNTSLALAIEMVGSGNVLLFPADAQVGSWLSWHKLAWQVEGPGAPGRTVTAGDLLRRTVLYKVGHHGSHNGTLKAAGLGQMSSPDLVALLPVDQDTARDVKRWTKMPFEPLLEELDKRTRGASCGSTRARPCCGCPGNPAG